MTAAAMASAIWQTTKECPSKLEVTLPENSIKDKIIIDTIPMDYPTVGVKKDSGDDPDVTDGCIVNVEVQILDYDGKIDFIAGKGIGIVTKGGLKLEVGEAAINPVPRIMTTNELRKIIGKKSAKVIVSIENGEELAKKTFNSRLGIVGGLSILGTSGIVRPMSEEAVKESLRLEMSVISAQGKKSCAFVMGYIGEKYLKNRFENVGSIVLCSNYIGYLLDVAYDMDFDNIIIAGKTGKLIKIAADIMHLHSHIADGRMEVLCTFAALNGADTDTIKKIYDCTTTSQAEEIIKENHLDNIWMEILKKACEKCTLRTHNKIKISMILLGESNNVLAESDDLDTAIEKWRENGK